MIFDHRQEAAVGFPWEISFSILVGGTHITAQGNPEISRFGGLWPPTE